MDCDEALKILNDAVTKRTGKDMTEMSKAEFDSQVRKIITDAKARKIYRAKFIEQREKAIAFIQERVKQAEEGTYRVSIFPRSKEGKRALAARQAINDLISSGRVRDEIGSLSLENRFDAVYGGFHKELVDILDATRGFALRRRAFSNNEMNQIVEDLFKKGSAKSAQSRAYASALRKVFDKVLERFNNAGGNINELADWNLMMRHSARRIKAARVIDEETGQVLTGEDAWVHFIKDKIHLDRIGGRYIDDMGNMVSRELGEDNVREVLGAIYRNLASDGTKPPKASELPRGFAKAIGNRHQEHRVLHFLDAEKYLDYHKMFGSGTIFDNIMGYIEVMSREIAGMEHFGPNPDAVMRSLRAEVVSMSGQKWAGSLAEASYKNVMGRVFGNETTVGNIIGTLRSIGTATKLGMAPISMISDLFYTAQTAYINGISPLKVYFRFAKKMFAALAPGEAGTEARKLSTRLYLSGEHALNNVRTAVRMQEITGYDWARRFADFSVRMSGMNIWTQTLKNSFGEEMFANLDLLAKRYSSWDKLPNRIRKSLQRSTINADDWSTIVKSERLNIKGDLPPDIEGVSYINPENLPDELAAKVVGMVRDEMRFAVPEPNAKTRAIINRGLPTGTFWGEVARSLGQFQTFGISTIQMPLMRGLNMKGMSRVGYLASYITGATAIGMVTQQTYDFLLGRDFRDFDDPTLITDGLNRSGAFGLIADVFMDEYSKQRRVSNIFTGPALQDMDKILSTLISSNAYEDWDKYVTNLKMQGVELAREVPGFATNMWYSRLLFDRMVMDDVRKSIDPHWRSKQRRTATNLRRRTGQQSWWKPGSSYIRQPRLPEMPQF